MKERGLLDPFTSSEVYLHSFPDNHVAFRPNGKIFVVLLYLVKVGLGRIRLSTAEPVRIYTDRYGAGDTLF